MTPKAAPQARPAQDLSALRDQAVDREFRMWAEYWIARYLGPDWERACAGWELHRNPNPAPFRVRDEFASMKPDQARDAEIRARLRDVWPDCQWSRAIVGQFRARVHDRIAQGWKVLDRSAWRAPTVQEQAEQLAWTHADQAAEAGIIPTREEIRARMYRQDRRQSGKSTDTRKTEAQRMAEAQSIADDLVGANS